MASATVFRQKQTTEESDRTTPAASHFSVHAEIDVPLVLESTQAVMIDNPNGGKIGKDLEKAPDKVHAYEVVFKAILKPEDLVLVTGLLQGHKLKAHLSPLEVE